MSIVIRKETVLRARDFRIHESAHFLIGIMFRLPMGEPEVFQDGSGGRVPFDRPALESAAAVDVGDVPENVVHLATLNICSMFAAGFAAEAIASDTDTTHVIGLRSEDLINAGQILEHTGLPMETLEAAWHRTVRILRAIWPLVTDLAKDIPETDGTHRPPKFH